MFIDLIIICGKFSAIFYSNIFLPSPLFLYTPHKCKWLTRKIEGKEQSGANLRQLGAIQI